jgi:NADH-quinone oxidoreductase subunit B
MGLSDGFDFKALTDRVPYPNLSQFERPNVITTTVDLIFSWARSHSVFPFTYGLACCAIEMLSSGFARFDVARYGMEVFRPTPRQCDLMIVAGTVNEKMAPVLKRLYEQMSEPKWVIAMGACATSGGPFYDGYNVVNGVDKVVPVDVYIPGCPPRPEALFQGLLELQKKIQAMRIVPPLPTAAPVAAAAADTGAAPADPAAADTAAAPADPAAADTAAAPADPAAAPAHPAAASPVEKVQG